MSRPGFRQHRLPPLRNLDYTLIPPPLSRQQDPAIASAKLIADFSTLTEKSALPSIVVTPSSPRSPQDYAIAFLAPEPKPSVFARMISRISSLKARTAIILCIILFILVCHLVTHSLAARRPFLEFQVQGEPTQSTFKSWFSLQSLWSLDDSIDDKREFVITELVGVTA